MTLATAAALAVGNQLGTSLFSLPASLAVTVGPAALVSWVLTALGFWTLAELFARLGGRYPATGGPAAFVREGFGDGWGFVTAWSYWGSVVVGNAGIALGTVAYVGFFVPALDASPALRAAVATAMLWGCVALNVRGVTGAGRFSFGLVLLQLIPVLLLLVALRMFEPAHLVPFTPNGVGAIGTGVALIIWGFSGAESATVSAEEIRGDPHAVTRATRIGFFVAAGAYAVAAVALAGVLPAAELGATARPLASVAARAVGPWGETAIAMVAIGGGLACLNGWVLLVGRLPLSTAPELMPEPLRRVHPRFATPHIALVTGTALSTVVLVLQSTADAVSAFGQIVLIANVGILVPYALTAAAAWRLAPTDGRGSWRLLAVLAGLFCTSAVLASGREAIVAGGLFVAVGAALYVLRSRTRRA